MIIEIRHTYHGRNALLAMLLLAFATSDLPILDADQSDKLLKATAQAEKTFNSNADKIVKSVLDCYDIAIGQAMKQGDFGLLEKLQVERKIFESKHSRPKLIPDLKYRQAISLACDRCLLSYTVAVATATKANDLLLANQLQDQKDAFVAEVERKYPDARIYRKTWKHPIGKFSTADGNVWIEKTPTNTYSFIETGRDLECVYLHDQARNISVVLSERTCSIKGAKGNAKVKYFGSWTE